MNLKTFLWTSCLLLLAFAGKAQQNENANNETIKWYLEKEHPFSNGIENREIANGENFDVACDFDFNDFANSIIAVTPDNETIRSNGFAVDKSDLSGFQLTEIHSGRQRRLRLLLFDTTLASSIITINFKNIGSEIPPSFSGFTNNSNLANKLGLNRGLTKEDIGRTFKVSCETTFDSLDLAEIAIFQNCCNDSDFTVSPLTSNIGNPNGNCLSTCYRDTITWVGTDRCGNNSIPISIYIDFVDYRASTWFVRGEEENIIGITGEAYFDSKCNDNLQPSFFIVTPCNDTITDRISNNIEDFSNFNESCIGSTTTLYLTLENSYEYPGIPRTTSISYTNIGTTNPLEIEFNNNEQNKKLAKKLGLEDSIFLTPEDFGRTFCIPIGTTFKEIDDVITVENTCNASDLIGIGRPPNNRILNTNLASRRNSMGIRDSIYWELSDNCGIVALSPSIYLEFLDSDDVKWFIDQKSPLTNQVYREISNGSSFDVTCFFNFSNFTDFIFAVTPCGDTLSGSDIKTNIDGIQDFNQLSICSDQGVIELSLFENNNELVNPISIYFNSLGTGDIPTLKEFSINNNLANKLGLDRTFLSENDIGKTFQISCETIIDSVDLIGIVIFENGCNATDLVGVGRPPKGSRLSSSSSLAISRNSTNACPLDSIYWVSEPDGCGNMSKPVSIFLEVIDTIPPIFTSIPPDITIQESSFNQLTNPTIAECNGYELNVVENVQRLPNINQNIFTRTWTATDDCGNTATATQKITILLESTDNCRTDCELQLPCPEDMYVVIPKGSNNIPITWTPPLPIQTNCVMETTECDPNPIVGYQYIGAFQGSKYYLSDNRDDVEDAIAAATAKGGHLLTIDNGDENNFIQENISEIVHIGINDLAQEGIFKKTDGTMPTYLNWGSFFLNNQENNYAIFQPWNGTWSLVNKWVYKHFVLEIPCNTETPPIVLSQTSGPMNGTEMGAGTYSISYEAEVCNSKANCDFTLKVVEAADCGNDCQGVPYCESEGINPWEEWIAHVGLGNIQHTSNKEGFGDFTNLSTTLAAGQRYDMSITANFSWQNTPNYLQVWIDFNRNDQFEATELVRQEILQVLPNFERIRNRQFSINVPSGIQTGATRMRISLNRGSASNPCGDITYGEVEDYSILLENRSQSRAIPMNQFRFTAFASGLKTEVQWVSNMGYKSSYFEIQRSIDGRSFTTIGQVDNASANEEIVSYQFRDEAPTFGVNYYRIKQLHTDASFLITAPQKVKFGNKSNSFTIFPNPAKKELFLSVKKANAATATIQLFNLLGQAESIPQIREVTPELLKLDIANISSGIYYLMVKIDGQTLKTKKVYIDQQE